MRHSLVPAVLVARLTLGAALVCSAQVPSPAAPAATPQGPPRAAPPGTPPRQGTAAIRGYVLALDGGAPVRRARVRASSTDMRDTRTATTDDRGRFELNQLPGGRYTLMASKGGYVTLQYGQRRPNEPGTPLVVADGQVLDKVVVGLPRGSVIAGRILDEAGEPLIGAQVSAMRVRAGGTRRVAGPGGPGATNRTDDQGGFRLYGLLPGDYLVSAAYRGDGIMFGDRGDDDGAGYAPTFYPGTPSLTEAQRISVAAGEEAGGIIFALTPSRLVRISGRVVTSNGAPARDAVVMARPDEGMGDATRTGMSTGGPVRDDGSFEIRGVAPGRYILDVPPSNNTEREFGRARVVVGGADVAGVLITTSRGATASGRIVTDEGVPPNVAPASLRIVAQPAGDTFMPMFGPPPRVNDDWTFTVAGLADRVYLRAMGAEGWYVKAVQLDGQDVTDVPLDFRSGAGVDGLTIILTRRVAEVSGAITEGRGVPVTDAVVVIFPDDDARWTEPSRFIRSTRPDQQGIYRFRALPAARYLIATVAAIEDGQLSDPEFLQSLRAAASPVTLGEGETKSVNLRTR